MELVVQDGGSSHLPTGSKKARFLKVAVGRCGFESRPLHIKYFTLYQYDRVVAFKARSL